MDRRAFLRTTTALTGLAATSGVSGVLAPARAQQREFAPRPGTWRTFEITTRVEVLTAGGLDARLAARAIGERRVSADGGEPLVRKRHPGRGNDDQLGIFRRKG